MARGSSAEVLTQSVIALEIGYFNNDIFEDIQERCKIISGMLTKLIKARSKEG